MKLGLFHYHSGHHVAAWRHPLSGGGNGLDLPAYISAVRTAERGKFDVFFLADGLAVGDSGGPAAMARSDKTSLFEPVTLLSVLSTVTNHLGLVGSASTTYTEPYHLARAFASLDHLSGGRAGWNLVTTFTDTEAANFGRDKNLDHALRYERAGEFVDVVRKLWDSWEDDAFARDKASGIFADVRKLHAAQHAGDHFSVRGGLNMERTPQGHPVVFQAGSSPDGRDLAARTADVVFTVQKSLESAQAFYADVKQRAVSYGRAEDSLLVMPGVFVIVDSSEARARERFEELQSLIDPAAGLALLSFLLGFDLSAYPVDGPVPELPQTNGQRARQSLLLDMARAEKLTIRQLYTRNAVSRGHPVVVGTAATVADHLEQWFKQKGADGFNVMPGLIPTDLENFVDGVVPELQRRALFRTDYEPGTLRDRLGLARPLHAATWNCAAEACAA